MMDPDIYVLSTESTGPQFKLSGASEGATGDSVSGSKPPKLSPEEEAMMQSALNDPRLQVNCQVYRKFTHDNWWAIFWLF